MWIVTSDRSVFPEAKIMKLKKVFVLFLTLCIALSAVPFAAWAEEETDGNMPEHEIEEPVPVPKNTEPEVLPPEEPVPPADPMPEQERPAPAQEEPIPAPAEPTDVSAEPEYLLPKVLANGGEYQALSEALADIGNGEFDVILLEDLSESATVGKDQNITLILSDRSFSGEIINYGKLTVFGSESSSFDGCIITRAYCERDENGNVLDEASGETVIEGGNYNGELILEQKSDARVSTDAQPKLRLSSGRFGVDLTKRYLNWDEESSEPEYSASAGSIVITGGVFFTDPSAYVADGYTAFANDGWWLVGPKTEEDAVPSAGEDNPAVPGAEIYIDTEKTDSTDASASEVTLPTEKKPVKPEEKVVLIDVDVNITGSGSVVFEGEEYGKGSRLKFVAYSEPVLEIRPAENWKIHNVTVGTNGSAIPFGTENTIHLPPLENYATVNVTFAEMKPEEIEALKAKTNEPEEADIGTPDVQPDETAEQPEEITEQSALSLADPLPGVTETSPLLGDSEETKYTVTFVTNGGAFTDGEGETREYSADAGYTLPTEIKNDDAASFIGWYGEPELENEVKDIAPGSSGNRTYYAKWKHEIAVTVYGNGKAIHGTETISQGATIKSFTGGSFTLNFEPGYNSKVEKVILNAGKADERQLDEPENYTDSSVSKNYTVDVYFVSCKTHAVTFENEKAETKTVYAEEGKALTFDTPVCEGYDFGGWLCEDDGELYPESGEYIVTKSVKFTAQWTLAHFTLTCQSNGEAIHSESFTIMDTVSLIIPTQEGATFQGWYLNPVFSGEPVSQIIGAENPHDVTVYAKWEYTNYTVTYVNEGTTESSREVRYGTKEILPSRARSGYTFLGWKCSADGKTYQPYAQYTVKSDVTFTAQWEKQKVYYTVSVYHTDNGAVYYNGQPLPSPYTINVEEGQTVELKFAATRSGYYVYNCTVDNARRGSVDGLTIGPVKGNVLVSVTFAPTFMRPITGDTNHLQLWACLMAASALGMTGTALLRKKRKAEKH